MASEHIPHPLSAPDDVPTSLPDRPKPKNDVWEAAFPRLKNFRDRGPKIAFWRNFLMCPKGPKMTKNGLRGASHGVSTQAAPP